MNNNAIPNEPATDGPFSNGPEDEQPLKRSECCGSVFCHCKKEEPDPNEAFLQADQDEANEPVTPELLPELVRQSAEIIGWYISDKGQTLSDKLLNEIVTRTKIKKWNQRAQPAVTPFQYGPGVCRNCYGSGTIRLGDGGMQGTGCKCKTCNGTGVNPKYLDAPATVEAIPNPFADSRPATSEELTDLHEFTMKEYSPGATEVRLRAALETLALIDLIADSDSFGEGHRGWLKVQTHKVRKVLASQPARDSAEPVWMDLPDEDGWWWWKENSDISSNDNFRTAAQAMLVEGCSDARPGGEIAEAIDGAQSADGNYWEMTATRDMKGKWQKIAPPLIPQTEVRA